MPLLARHVAAAAAGLAALAALAGSTIDRVPWTWDVLAAERAQYAGLSPEQREEHYGARLPLPMDVFRFYRDALRTGDRYYVQVPPGGFGAFADLRTTVRAVGRLWLLPAIEVDDPRDADVVLSWQADPAQLGLRYSEQRRAGLQLFFASRVARDR